MNFSHLAGGSGVKVPETMRATVTLWTEGKDGRRRGVSEFLLDEPDEPRFLLRARNLFKMVSTPFAPLCAHLAACGGKREVDATRADPDAVARRLWAEYRTLCPPEC